MALTAHVKHLLIAGIAAAVLLLSTWKLIAHFDQVDHDQVVLAQQQLKQDQQQAKAQAGTTATDTAALQKQVAALQQSNNALQASLSDLEAQLASQRQKDATASPEALSARWRGLLGTGQITATPAGLTADLPAAHATVDQLEQLPVVQQELKDEKANSTQKDVVLAGDEKLLNDVKAELATCQKVQVDADALCKAQVKEVKAQARKHSLMYAIGAFIGGLIAGHKF